MKLLTAIAVLASSIATLAVINDARADVSDIPPTTPCMKSSGSSCLPGTGGRVSAYAYVPDTTNCKVAYSMGSYPGFAVTGDVIDDFCMRRQRINAGLRYCAKFKQHCSPQVEMFGSIPMQVDVPNEDSGFWDLTPR